ncbi:MAG: FAD-dependent oxidoreductase [Candidatus Eremiobacteraeota bacterium]|nr:FAD-dependent oxidoreductase [Candidatus Eremiobacteraeota bacterium]
METLDCHTLIVGAGLSGLACALTLERSGVDWLLIEKNPAVGGRVQTRKTDAGYLLDHGFQVLNTAYPALHRLIDITELNLGEFESGAEVFLENRFQRVADPLRKPGDLLASLASQVGGTLDKLHILRLVWFCQNPGSADSVSSMTTEEFLCHFGFSKVIVDRFFRPFFGGVFLEEELLTSARKFVTLFSYFSRGSAALPAGGMQALPELLASKLPADRIKLGVAAEQCEAGAVHSETLSIRPRHLALAGWQSQHRLLKTAIPQTHSAYTLYFSRPKTDGRGKTYLKLNGSPHGGVQTVAFNSAVQPTYAPHDRDLIAVSARRKTSEGQVREELTSWFGDQVLSWEHLHSDHIRQALPQEFNQLRRIEVREFEGLQVHCLGDHTETGSIQGALTSGRKAGLAIAGG